MSAAELAAYICTSLKQRGIEVVLSGGSCVAVYSSGKYVSKDLDFIEVGLHTDRAIREAMESIGFERRTGHFRHPESAFLVDFPKGPLAVGKEPVGETNEIKFSTGILRILCPTDCVKDRLAAYYHWKDRQCLEQAALVAKSNDIDLSEVERWSKREGKLAEFRLIAGRLRRT